MKQNTLASGVERVKAIAASGIFVKVEANVFLTILAKSKDSIVVESHSRVFLSESHQYLTFYKGLFFYTEAPKSILLPEDIELIRAERIWIPF